MNYTKFAEPATNYSSNLGVNPGNSRKIQQTTQILCQLHNTSANHAKFATFANNRQDKLCISYTFLHIFHYMYFTCMHTSYMLTVFCVKMYVLLYQIAQLFQDQLHSLTPIAHQHTQKKKKKKKKKLIML